MNKKTNNKKASTLHSKTAPLETLAIAQRQPSQKIIVTFVFFSLFLLYLRTLMTSTPPGDSGELITSAYLLGIPHPPGYPLFNLLGKFFSFIPLGNLVWRINLSAAVFNLGASFFVYLTLNKLLNHWLPALFAAVFFALSPLVWEYSIKAEVFSLNNFFAALILYLLITIREYALCTTQAFPHHVKEQKVLYLLFFICGLALTNHHTVILLAPMVLIFLLGYCRNLLSYRSVLISLLAFLLGLSLYLYLPIRAAAEPYLNWDDAKTWGNFIQLITRADYGSFQLMNLHESAYSVLEKYGLYLVSVAQQFNPVGIVLLLCGIFFLIRKQDKALSFGLLAGFVMTSFLFFTLANVPKTKPLYLGVFERFYMLPSVFIALFIGMGIYFLQQVIVHHIKKKQWGLGLLYGLIILALGFSLGFNFPRIKHFGHYTVQYYGVDVLNSLEKNALVLTLGDTNLNTLDTLKWVYHLRPDVAVLDQEKLTYSWYCQQMKKFYPDVVIPFTRYDGQKGLIIQLINANIGKRPIYVLGGTKENSLFASYRLMPVGLVRKVVDKNYWPNPPLYIKENEHIWSQYHRTKRHFPNTSFEHQIVYYYALAHFYLGWEYQQAGLFDLAIEEYQNSIRIDPLLFEPYKNLGVIYANATHQLDKAARVWQEYLVLNPQDKDKEVIASFIKSYMQTQEVNS